MKYPWYVWLVSMFQDVDDDYLTRSERWYLARRYSKTIGNKTLGPDERAALIEWKRGRTT